jgi:RNA polymerase-binding transcription factor DksA
VEITTDAQLEKEMNDAQRQRFEKRLLDERARITATLDRMNSTARSEEERDQAGDLSAMPTHPADLGSDEQQRELDTSVNQNQSETLAEIDAALERLYKTPERYGVDERTGKPIPQERLDVIPWARFDVNGQSAEEKRDGA